MHPEVRRLFHELADLSAGDRARALSERHIAPELRSELESLLDFDRAPQQGLTESIADTARSILDSVTGPADRCGPYRLIRLLGSGGMGAVYLAERPGAELHRKVAIKLLHAGEQGAIWHERFRRERQLLASLHHPAIVQVIDAGQTEDGKPYLVMEYVEGKPIDEYAQTLDLRDRLKLFLRVADGIAYAHSHLIIHRDLKPSNILVNSSGQPKVLDFGIAKLLDETGDPTRTVERMLTPNYASPEQILGRIQTTASDVYSLSATLYKLLTGWSPHESEAHTSQALEIVAGSREITAASDRNANLPSDLDYILRKALRKEPEERYASVEALAGDVRAFLASRPIQARSGDTWYRTRKFLRRYWVQVTAAALVIASLSAGLYVANRERVIAQRRFQQLRQLSTRVLDLDSIIRDIPGTAQARQRLVSVTLEYLEGLASDAQRDPELARDIARAYEKVAVIQGVPTEPNLGDPERAKATLKKADALIESVLRVRPRDRAALNVSANIAEFLMILSQEAGQRQDALAYAHKAVAQADAFLHQGAATDQDKINSTSTYANAALALINMHLYAEAVPYARRAIDIVRNVPASQFRVAEGLSLLANAQRYQGDLQGALQSILEARKISEKSVYQNETVRAIDKYGVLLREGYILGDDGGVNLGRPHDAIEPLQTALDMSEDMARKNPRDSSSRSHVGTSADTLANILRQREPSRALPLYDLAIRRLGELEKNPTARRGQARALADSSLALLRLKRPTEARARIDQALNILKETKDYPASQIRLDSVAYCVVSAMAENFAAGGNLRQALETYQLLLEKVTASKPEPLTDLRDAPTMSQLYAALAGLYQRSGDMLDAARFQARRRELWQSWDRRLPNNSFVRSQLGAIPGTK